MTIEYNKRAAVAAAIEDLAKDRDLPIYVDGDMWTGRDYGNMGEGEAARIVVDTVLEHPYVQAALNERDAYWEALKFLVDSLPKMPQIPDEHMPVILAVVDAVALDRVQSSAILGDEAP